VLLSQLDLELWWFWGLDMRFLGGKRIKKNATAKNA
jgi:hypothetical protein